MILSGADNPLTAYPRISPTTLLARKQATGAAFPFDGSGFHFEYHYARNAIWALCGAWTLAGQEVLVPAYVEGVELDALLRAGVRPRFYRVDSRMRFSADDLWEHLTPNTRAVYVIHYLGFPQGIGALAEACRQRGVLLVEDCAQALLSRSGSRPLGTFGDAAVFSFRKSLPVPDGGVLVLHQSPPGPLVPPRSPPEWPSRIAVLGSALRQAPGASWWLYPLWPTARSIARCLLPESAASSDGAKVEPAANLGISKISSFILARQDLAHVFQARRANYRCLEERLRHLLPPLFALTEGVCPLLYAARVPRKQEALQLLRQVGVEAADHWPANHPLLHGRFPEVDALHATVIGLPCQQTIPFHRMTDWADRIASLIEENPSVFTAGSDMQTV